MDNFPYISELSAGYWLLEGLQVEPNDGIEVPLVQEHVYGMIQDDFYRMESTPMLMKHVSGEYHFEIHPKENVRLDTIEMPFEMVADIDVDHEPPSEEQFLLAKPEHAHMLYRMSRNATIEG